jgi:uncharacterized protein (DUF3820 family)
VKEDTSSIATWKTYKDVKTGNLGALMEMVVMVEVDGQCHRTKAAAFQGAWL